MPNSIAPTDLPSLHRLRAGTSPAGTPPFRVGILVGPGFIPMDMVGVQTVFGLMLGAEIHLLWKSLDLVEGFPSWWTMPTTRFEDCPALDVLAVPMLPPEIQGDADVIAFVAAQARQARYTIGICNGVLLLGAAGILAGKRVTASHPAMATLADLGVAEIIAPGAGVVVDDGLFTAGPGVGSFEAALLVVANAFGRRAAELAELIIEYDPHPPFGSGLASTAKPELVAQFDALMGDLVASYRRDAVAAFVSRKAA